MLEESLQLHGMRGLAPLPSQVLTLGCHSFVKKDMEKDVAKGVVEPH